MAGHPIGAKALRKVHREPLAQPARVHKHERRLMLRDQLGNPRIDLFPHFRRHHGLERRRWDLERQIECADMARVHDGGQRLAGADQELSDLLDWPLGGREADPLWPLADQRVEPRQRQRQMAAALVTRHGVDFVDDHRADRAQHLARALGGENQIQGLRRGDEDVGWATEHRLPFRLWRVTGPNQRPDLDVGQALLRQRSADFGERLRQILLYVVGQRFERGDVDDLHLIPQLAA